MLAGRAGNRLSHRALLIAAHKTGERDLGRHDDLRPLGGSGAKLPSFDEARDEFTRNYLSQILQVTGGNVSQAARLAKRNRTDFYKLLGRHQLLPDDFKKS